MDVTPHFGPLEVALLLMFLGLIPIGPSLVTPVILLFMLAGQPVPESLAKAHSESQLTIHQDTLGESSCHKPCHLKTSRPR